MTEIRGVGAPGVGANGGRVTPINNLGATLQPLVAANPFREFIQFQNPGTQTIYVTMERDASGKPLAPSPSSLAGAFAIAPGAMLMIAGECQLAWNGFAASGTSNPVTVFESNLS